MRRILRQLQDPRDDRLALVSDAAGAVALFVLLMAALYAPLIA